jgi:hypothetical protein
LLAGPLFALALYQRYAYRSVVATRDAETDALTAASATTARSRPICARRWRWARPRARR